MYTPYTPLLKCAVAIPLFLHNSYVFNVSQTDIVYFVVFFPRQKCNVFTSYCFMVYWIHFSCHKSISRVVLNLQGRPSHRKKWDWKFICPAWDIIYVRNVPRGNHRKINITLSWEWSTLYVPHCRLSPRSADWLHHCEMNFSFEARYPNNNDHGHVWSANV